MIQQAKIEFQEKLNLIEINYEDHVGNPEGFEVRMHAIYDM